MEVNKDKLRDIGVDFGTGDSGASGYTTAPFDNKLNSQEGTTTLAGRNLFSEFTPSIFGPLEGTTSFPGTYPFAGGMELIYKKLTGTEFELIIHALEENADVNTLSSPRIMTLDNQEASILVGRHEPILDATVTAGTETQGTTITQSLDYYQEIGIRLNVVPQVNEDGYINMIIHPSITSSTTNVTATSQVGTDSVETNYPVINVREAQTQVLMKDGETIVIGGLLKDVQSKQTIGVPFLSQIPFIGWLFRRDTYDTEKIELLIFITAHIVEDGEYSPELVSDIKERIGYQTTSKIDQLIKPEEPEE